MGAKERVVEAAIRLFNERGTAAVSTNHIADGAGISPGNLYYHFRNKEEIIRAIFGRMIAAWEAMAEVPQDRAPTSDRSAGNARRDLRGALGVPLLLPGVRRVAAS